MCVAARVPGLAPLGLHPVRRDGLRTGRRSRHRLGDLAHRRPFAQEHRARQAQVAPRREHQHRHAHQEQQPELPIHHERRHNDHRALDHRHRDLRRGLAQQLRDRAHITGRAGREVAGPRALHRPQRQPQHPVDERLPQTRRRALAQPVTHAAAGAHQHQLQHDARHDRGAHQVHTGCRPARADPVDDLAEHHRQRRARPRGEHVQGDHARERAAVGEDQALDGLDHRGAAGDRQPRPGLVGAHQDSCLDVRDRYSPCSDNSAWDPTARTLPSTIHAT
jgi:hypothetical protein